MFACIASLSSAFCRCVKLKQAPCEFNAFQTKRCENFCVGLSGKNNIQMDLAMAAKRLREDDCDDCFFPQQAAAQCEDLTRGARLDSAIATYLKGLSPLVADGMVVVKCKGICGFFLNQKRYRFITHFTDETGVSSQVTVLRSHLVTGGLHTETSFFSHAEKWPKEFAVVGTWDKPFITAAGDVMMRNFSSVGLLRPANSIDEDFQSIFKFGLSLGSSFDNTMIPAWKIVVKNAVREGPKRIVKFEFAGKLRTLTQYQVKGYDTALLTEGGQYLLLGIKAKTDEDFVNSSCNQFVPRSAFSDEQWELFGEDKEQPAMESLLTSDCM